MRLIDAEKLPNDKFWEGMTLKEKTKVLSWFLSAPTVDAVEVVRCVDCAVPHNKWLGCPNLNGLIPPPDFYCAKGERKDET